jgi:predicted nucleotide-binding protein
MALQFKGTKQELEAQIAAAGIRGAWEDISNGHRFRSDDSGVLTWYPKTGSVTCQGNGEAAARLEKALQSGTEMSKRVFVVHGHDKTAVEQLELVLHRLHLDPFVLVNTAGGGLTIIEALEAEIMKPGRISFGIVLMTPDDMGYSATAGTGAALPRARQNVILEMGMLIAALGRPRVAMLRTGNVEIPSDANGILYIAYEKHIREAVPRLVQRLQAAGFDLDANDIAAAST